MKLIASASIQIQKPITEVYEGIVNPVHMTQYFISQSSGKMETAAQLTWSFPEFPEAFSVSVLKSSAPEHISFSWEEDTVVEINLKSANPQSTIVAITEGVRAQSDENIQWAIGNTAGWANFLACLKAYLEYGINLRKGAFDFKAEHPQ